MQILRAADRVPVPWKNGGGVTREVARWPADGSLEHFDWRISIAEVAASGPFSCFPGIDRVLTVLEGDEMRLAVDGRPVVELAAGSAPHAFPGDADCTATLTGSPIVDLNVMTRRAAWTAIVRRVTSAAVDICPLGWTVLVALDGGQVDRWTLARHDALVRRGDGSAGRLNCLSTFVVIDLLPSAP